MLMKVEGLRLSSRKILEKILKAFAQFSTNNPKGKYMKFQHRNYPFELRIYTVKRDYTVLLDE